MKNIYTELSKPFPDSAIERTKGSETRKGYDTTGIKYQYIVNRLNEVLGVGGFRVEREFSIIEKTAHSGKPMFEATCDILMQLGSWAEGDFIPIAEAVSTGGHTSGNIADAKKGSFTNGFKKAAAFFGCGWQAYAGALDDDNIPQQQQVGDGRPVVGGSAPQNKQVVTNTSSGRVTHAQMGKLRQLVDQMNGNWADYKAHVKTRLNKQIQYISKREASTLIDELIKRERRVG
jgi:Rad52/22 family double-strand break repair protein